MITIQQKIVSSIIVLTIITFFLSGCTDNPPENNDDIYSRFAGTWKQDDGPLNQEWVFTFFQNGSYKTNHTVPGEYVILNETHLDLIIQGNSATYAFEFLNNDQTLTLSLYGWGSLEVTYVLEKVE